MPRSPHKASADLQQRRAEAEAKLADLRARLDAELDPDRILSLRRAIRDAEEEAAAFAAAVEAQDRAARDAEEAARRERLRKWREEDLPRCRAELDAAREPIVEKLRAAADEYNALLKLYTDWEARWREVGAPLDARIPSSPPGPTVAHWATYISAPTYSAFGAPDPFPLRLHDALHKGTAG